MKFPNYRPRRMRKTEALRKLVRESDVSLDQLVMPYFLVEGKGTKEEIQSMPGQFRFSTDRFLFELEELEAIRAYDAAKASGEKPVDFERALAGIEKSRR